MKFSEAWLRQWVNPSLDSDELLFQMTMAGLEVDGTEPAAQAFSGVVVGEIISAEQHPDADKLRVCQVSNGLETFQVVCPANATIDEETFQVLMARSMLVFHAPLFASCVIHGCTS